MIWWHKWVSMLVLEVSGKCEVEILRLSSLTCLFLHVTSPNFVRWKTPEIPNSTKNIPGDIELVYYYLLLLYERLNESYLKRWVQQKKCLNKPRQKYKTIPLGEGNSRWWWRCRVSKWQNHEMTFIACWFWN